MEKDESRMQQSCLSLATSIPTQTILMPPVYLFRCCSWITEINTLTGEVKNVVNHVAIYPASHYIVPQDKMAAALEQIRQECDERVAYFKANNKLIEAQRIAERTNYDIEMLQEIGFCKGIENYSRVISGRKPGSTPYTLLDYFPKDF